MENIEIRIAAVTNKINANIEIKFENERIGKIIIHIRWRIFIYAKLSYCSGMHSTLYNDLQAFYYHTALAE